MENGNAIWSWFKTHTNLNNYAIAGIMGNIDCESSGRPNNLQDSYQSVLGYSDEKYSDAVSNGTYRYKTYANARSSFGFDDAGYGLCQWTSSDRKLYMYDKIVGTGKRIDNMNAQLEFLWWELNNGYKYVLNTLRSATSVDDASKVVLQKYEIPQDWNTAAMINLRLKRSMAVYNEFAGTTVTTDSSDSSSLKEALTEFKQGLNNAIDKLINSL